MLISIELRVKDAPARIFHPFLFCPFFSTFLFGLMPRDFKVEWIATMQQWYWALKDLPMHLENCVVVCVFSLKLFGFFFLWARNDGDEDDTQQPTDRFRWKDNKHLFFMSIVWNPAAGAFIIHNDLDKYVRRRIGTNAIEIYMGWKLARYGIETDK